jgi:phosphate starvation-inducible protein PhoH
MRPLFDALYDTMDADRLNAYIDRGTIEGRRPLAFMRGSHTERLVRDPRRGAEHDARAECRGS